MVPTLFLAALAPGMAVSTAFAQSSGWSEPVPLSDESTTSWFPDVAVDAGGRIHVAWSSGAAPSPSQAYDTVVYASSIDGRSWSAPLDIVALPSKGAVTRPALLSEPSGTLHMTYRSYMIYYTHGSVQAVNANALLPARPISSGDNGYFSQLLLDSAGRLHVFYTEYAEEVECPECLHVFHRFSDDDGLTWSLAVDITPGASGAAKPQVLQDGQGRMHLTWEAGRGGDLGQIPDPTTVMYTASDDGGTTWRTPIKLSPDESRARNVTLGLGGNGQLVAAWLGLPADEMTYRKSEDGGLTWSDSQAIPGAFGAWAVYQGRTDGYSMVTDGAGIVHLLAVGRTSASEQSLSVLHITWDGSAWSSPEAVVTLTGDVPEWPRAAIGLGNELELVWFVRDQAHIWGGPGDFLYRIWYANRPLDLPAQEPIVFPTLTPAGSVPAGLGASPTIVEPTPTPQVAAVPLSTLAPQDAIPPADVEKRSVLLVLLAMVPVGMLLGGVVLVSYFRRR
jgi:hypothetical protein